MRTSDIAPLKYRSLNPARSSLPITSCVVLFTDNPPYDEFVTELTCTPFTCNVAVPVPDEEVYVPAT
jgi:hypothetical protein